MNSSAHFMTYSATQLQQLLFAPYIAPKPKYSKPDAAELVTLAETREFTYENTEGFIREGKKTPLKNCTFSLKGLGLPVLNKINYFCSFQ